MTYQELMEDAYGEEGNTRSLSPHEGFTPPSADDFFAHLEEMYDKPIYYAFTADMEYRYQDTEGYGWLAWGMLYIAIPEYDTYERYAGKWACAETLVEAVESCQHSCWKHEQERREFIQDINNHLSKL
jgi:hypothetical protein